MSGLSEFRALISVPIYAASDGEAEDLAQAFALLYCTGPDGVVLGHVELLLDCEGRRMVFEDPEFRALHGLSWAPGFSESRG